MIDNKAFLPATWPAPVNVFAATTLRHGGFSSGYYHSLNPALHVGDDAGLVRRNRRYICEQLKLPAEPVWLDQVHGVRVVDAAEAQSPVSADAGYSHLSNIVCAVLTADCLPVLMCSTDGNSIAAVHAGWRGLLAGVIGNTVRALRRSDLLVWLGPAIGPNAFEVGAEVRRAFVGKNPKNKAAFKPGHNAKWLADIYRLARIELAEAGIDRVYGGEHCTLTEAEYFYSYRRDKVTGRMATLIWRT
ncbi:MAG: peptidoglycan editing factor PgeF [Gammaproteobacteria bacterium HGW-Gammaproteobacteria-10]|nr:MAG: peptidoglycan editing factor PgeF [Gammaproteobacteria bacterium HGW-Gammaproteobacteria-3]PKM35625.1 MAG: peptidoglycan editing factor PgeF [Gammaproteobacteria bacterium HGW-Gammaproteobacteria-10]